MVLSLVLRDKNGKNPHRIVLGVGSCCGYRVDREDTAIITASGLSSWNWSVTVSASEPMIVVFDIARLAPK